MLAAGLGLVAKTSCRDPSSCHGVNDASVDSASSNSNSNAIDSRGPIISVPLAIINILSTTAGGCSTFDSNMIVSLRSVSALRTGVSNGAGAADQAGAGCSRIIIRTRGVGSIPNVRTRVGVSNCRAASFRRAHGRVRGRDHNVRLTLKNVNTISFLITTVNVTGAVVVSISRHAQRVNVVGTLNYCIGSVHAVFLYRTNTVNLINKLVTYLVSTLKSLDVGLLSFNKFDVRGMNGTVVNNSSIDQVSIVP